MCLSALLMPNMLTFCVASAAFCEAASGARRLAIGTQWMRNAPCSAAPSHEAVEIQAEIALANSLSSVASNKTITSGAMR